MNYADFCEIIPDADLPPVDQPGSGPVNEMQCRWQWDGFVILPRFLPDSLIDAYCRVREKITDPNGYPTPTPYLTVAEIADVCCYGPLAGVMEQIIGEPMGLHLNLSGWVSSQRDWHADSYLAPAHVGGFYVAAWFALDNIHPDSGPFEFIPGSHQPANRKLSLGLATAELRRRGIALDDGWAKQTECFLSEIVEAEIVAAGRKPRQFIARRGDVLLWHSGLIHRGSAAKVPGMERRALIAHYSGIRHKHSAAWPDAIQHHAGGWLFPFGK